MNKIIHNFSLIALLAFSGQAGNKLNLYKVPGEKRPKTDPGKVLFSNGKEWIGKITMTRGRKLRINTQSGMKKIPLTKIREIKTFPEKREMVQKWMFPEAGKTEKEKYGDPYPIQHLKAVVFLKNGEKLHGHLYSTVLYLRPNVGKKKRIVLMSKQRGKEKETFSDLVYPEQIIIDSNNAKKKEITTRLELPKNFRPEDYEIAALGIPDLMEVGIINNKNIIRINGELSEQIFTGIKKGNKITVFWPGENNQSLFDQVKKSISDMSDFFDQRELKAIYWPNKGKIIYSLTLMIRKAHTSLHKDKSNPWRLIIQRWRYDEKAGKLLLSDKGWLFRGIDKRGAHGPEVEISHEKCKKIHHPLR